MTEMTYGIVAGYDGSPGSGDALRWAAREAKARGTTLTVCLALTPDHMTLPTESDLCDLARQAGGGTGGIDAIDARGADGIDCRECR